MMHSPTVIAGRIPATINPATTFENENITFINQAIICPKYVPNGPITIK